ncbi:hypothetical protein BD410DRAFT_808829 [Rickenella mellea]|uniref:G domain-containing protein n=1 Tax=Rickenella mellea TaxID=50990 RepID=A0A4Y7PJZ7_9AGAM|nr:hypothetical protein BD410DRAFT_808829 [Rickenella mellea]
MASQSLLRVGDGLESCTMTIQLSTAFNLDGYNVTLIDTPGFDDTMGSDDERRSDTEILKLISTFLSTSYGEGHTLSGVIYLHRISDVKMGGTSRRNFTLFRKLCGDTTLKNVVILTTMWDTTPPATGALRENELATKDKFFKPACDLGAQIVRFSPRTPTSAHTILRRLIANKPEVLQVQDEMVNRNLHFSQTAAGTELGRELREQAERHSQEISKLEKEIRELAVRDAETRAELNAERQRLQGEIKRVEADSERMASDFRAHKEAYEKKIAKMEGTQALTGLAEIGLGLTGLYLESKAREDERNRRKRDSDECTVQ